MDKIQVLWLTNMFPSKASQKGVFVKEQMMSVSNANDNYEHHVFNIDDYSRFHSFKYLACICKLLKTIINKKIKIIHVHFGLSAIPLFPLLFFIVLSKIRIVITCHGSDLMGSSLVNFLTNVSVFISNLVILVSSEQRRFLWAINKKKNILIIPCGVDSSFFEYRSLTGERLGNCLRVIFPSSKSRTEKNYKAFLKIVSQLENKGLDVSVIHFENMSRDSIRDAYYNNDILLLTSNREGSPQVVKEAVFTGMPVVSFDVGDVGIILDGSNECLVSNKLEEIVEFIINFHMSGTYRLSKQFVSKIVDEYDVKNISNKIIIGYSSIL